MLRDYGTFILGLLLFILLWTAHLLGWLGEPVEAEAITLLGWSLRPSLPLQTAINASLVVTDIVLLFHFVNEYSLFNTRTCLAQGLFLVFMGGTASTMTQIAGNGCLTLTLLAFGLLFQTYHQTRMTDEYLTAFLLFGLATLLAPRWMLLLPAFIACCGILGSLKLNSLFAALIGLITPYWIAAGVLFCVGEFDHFLFPFREMAVFSPIDLHHLTIAQWSSLALVTLLSLPALFSYPFSAYLLKERTRMSYLVFIVLFLYALVLAFLQPTLIDCLFPLLACFTSLFITKMTLTARNKTISQTVVFLVTLLYITRPLWIPSSIF